jgi:hypothetical protein
MSCSSLELLFAWSPVSGTGFGSNEPTRRLQNPSQTRCVFLKDGPPAVITKRPYSLCNDDGTGARALIEQFPDHRFEGMFDVNQNFLRRNFQLTSNRGVQS